VHDYRSKKLRKSSGAGDSSILCVGVNGAGSKSSVTDVTNCDTDSFENTNHGRVLCGTCHSHQPLAKVECAKAKC
jgi:hypothetical protein